MGCHGLMMPLQTLAASEADAPEISSMHPGMFYLVHREKKRANDLKVVYEETKQRLESVLKDQRLMARKVHALGVWDICVSHGQLGGGYAGIPHGASATTQGS